MSPRAVNFIRKWHPNAPLSALRLLHTDTAGLDTTGTKYIVEKGDGPWAIAQKLTGNGNRWTELKAVNTDKNPTVDKNVWVGEVLTLPASWQKPTAVVTPPAAALPAVPLPSLGPVPSTGVPILPTPTIDITPSILQAKSILVAWANTDGLGQGGVSAYGTNVADLSTTMGARDVAELAAFQVWNNKTMFSTLNTTGALDPATLAALQSWAEARAAAAVPAASGTIPVGTATFPPVATLPSGEKEGTGIQVIPTVIGGTAPPAAATPAVASKPAGKQTSMAPALLGAVVGGVLFGVPGALVGGAAGAAIA